MVDGGEGNEASNLMRPFFPFDARGTVNVMDVKTVILQGDRFWHWF